MAKVIIYEKKTGKEIKLNYPIDAKEWLKSNLYTETKPKATETK